MTQLRYPVPSYRRPQFGPPVSRLVGGAVPTTGASVDLSATNGVLTASGGTAALSAGLTAAGGVVTASGGTATLAVTLTAAGGVATAASQRYVNVVLGDAPSGYWRLGESSGTVADD